MLVLLRAVLALALVACALLPATRDWRGLRVPAIFLGLFAATMLLQLVPIPVAWWLRIPGHSRYGLGVEAGANSMMPLSLVPDLTLNSLLALMPALCAMLAYSGMRPEHRWATAWLVATVAALSFLLALGQTGNEEGGAYLYGRRQDYSGLFTNRNHQAVMLGAVLPVLAVLARHVVRWRHSKLAALGLAGLGLVILPVILLTGSRQGSVLAGVGLLVAMLLAPKTMSRQPARFTVTMPAVAAAGLALVAILVLAALATNRAISINRWMAPDAIASDVRLRNLPTVVAMTREFFPVGIGYGAFDPVYRGFEPDAVLNASYFNHAHNDLLEMILTGGLPAALLVATFVAYVLIRGWRSFGCNKDVSHQSNLLDRAGLAVALLFLAASVVDYPLRTPLASLIFALAICWLSAPPALRPKRLKPATERLAS